MSLEEPLREIMRNFSNWLQTNPWIIVAMFFVSSLSGIAGLLLGWDQLYKDYLSKTIEIPVWLLFLCLLLFPGMRAIYKSFNRSWKKDLEKIEGKKFGVQRVVIDGREFERCEFHGTEILFEGSKVFSLSRCSFFSPKFSVGKHAALTLEAFTTMYTDPAFRPVIDATIENIRANKRPQTVEPSIF